MKRTIAICLLFAVLGCTERGRPARPPRPIKAAGTAALRPQAPDILEFAYGAAVVSRTGEVTLENSAMMLLDSDGSSYWLSPPGDPHQSIVFSLPSPSLIERVGARTSSKVSFAAHEIEFESSQDGVHFTPLAHLTMQPRSGDQCVDVKPAEAAYVRVSTLDGTPKFTQLNDVLVRGHVLDPSRKTADLSGAWAVNGQTATLRQDGAAAYGNVGDLLLDGGYNGRFYRFAWARGNGYGLAAFSVTPDGRHLSGIWWHEAPLLLNLGGTWFGTRTGPAPSFAPDTRVLDVFMARAGSYPLFGLSFADDGTLEVQASDSTLRRLAKVLAAHRKYKLRLVVRVLQHETEKANLDTANVRLATLAKELRKRGIDLENVQLVPVGTPSPDAVPYNPSTRAIYGTVDLEIQR